MLSHLHNCPNRTTNTAMSKKGPRKQKPNLAGLLAVEAIAATSPPPTSLKLKLLVLQFTKDTWSLWPWKWNDEDRNLSCRSVHQQTVTTRSLRRQQGTGKELGCEGRQTTVWLLALTPSGFLGPALTLSTLRIHRRFFAWRWCHFFLRGFTRTTNNSVNKNKRNFKCGWKWICLDD